MGGGHHTAIGTDEGVLYWAGILNLFSRRLVGWAMDEHMPHELTQAALDMAILQRQPSAELLHHSDQGSQYTSDDYQALLAKHRLLVSFSGVGCCYDNAPMESFWARSKLSWSIASTTIHVLKPNLPFLRIVKAGITANVAIHLLAILAPHNSNISFRLNCVSVSHGQGHTQ